VFRTNRHAKNFKLIQIDLEQPAESNWVDLVPEHRQDQEFGPVLRIHDILGWIRIRIWIRGSMPLTNGSGSDPAIFVIDLPKMPTKN
jgi:hypothetical protein